MDRQGRRVDRDAGRWLAADPWSAVGAALYFAMVSAWWLVNILVLGLPTAWAVGRLTAGRA